MRCCPCHRDRMPATCHPKRGYLTFALLHRTQADLHLCTASFSPLPTDPRINSAWPPYLMAGRVSPLVRYPEKSK
jgi:hypothetical protein